MGAKRVRIETLLDDGTKILVSMNGSPDRRRISKFLDLLELMGAGSSPEYNGSIVPESNSLMDRLVYVIRSNLIGRWFSINEVGKEFEKEFGVSLKKSTLATYLSRLSEQGILVRGGSRGSYKYTLNLVRNTQSYSL